MKRLPVYTLMAALSLGAFPVFVPAGEAPATGAASPRDAERQLEEARRRLDAAAQEVARLSGQMGRRFNIQLGIEPGEGPPPRALLGVVYSGDSGREGARVIDVSPGGAAAEAGIKPGDLITGIADLDLTKDANPGRALVEKVRDLAPDQKVKVSVLRDGKKLAFDVTPRPAPPDVLFMRRDPANPGNPGLQGGRGRDEPRPQARRLDAPPGGPEVGPGPGMLREYITVRNEESETRFAGVEFATLSERLGSYFGVKSGVLVVRAGVNSPFKLQDGDVILAIDGRETATAQQAGRILRSYQPGEKLTLKVQRDRKVQSLDATAPGGRRD